MSKQRLFRQHFTKLKLQTASRTLWERQRGRRGEILENMKGEMVSDPQSYQPVQGGFPVSAGAQADSRETIKVQSG